MTEHSDEATPRESPEDAARLQDYADTFTEAVARHIGPWVERSLQTRLASANIDVDSAVTEQVRTTRDHVAGRVIDAFRLLMNTDIDQQRTTPLEIIRGAVPLMTAMLEQHHVAPVERDPFDQQQFPHDLYGLSPHHVSDIDESLHEAALVWGAAKAHVHLQRHQHKRQN